MGMILEDKGNNIHCEKRRGTIVIYSDFGDQSIEMTRDEAKEAVDLLNEAISMFATPHAPGDAGDEDGGGE